MYVTMAALLRKTDNCSSILLCLLFLLSLLLVFSGSVIVHVLRNLVPFVQSKKHENTNGESVPLWMFFAFFKLYKWNQIAQSISMLMGTFNAQPAGSI